MDKKKIIVALALLPAFIWLIGWAPFWLVAAGVLVLGAGLGGWESARLVFGAGDPTFRYTAVVLSLLACLAAGTGDPKWIALATTGSVLLAMTLAGLFSHDLATVTPRAAKMVFVALYPGLLAGYILALKRLEPGEMDAKLLMMLFALVWVNDAGAFFVGSALGKRKLAPKISPNKSWEGSLGGFAATMILGVCLGLFGETFSVGQGLLAGALMGIVGPVGDLVESAMKRGAGLKDSGVLLPGHGGVLDRIDSVIFCAPVLYYLLLLL